MLIKIGGVLLMALLATSCTKSPQVIDPVANLTVQSGVSANITYDTVEGHELKLDVIVPRIGLGQAPWWRYDQTKRPALLYIHGGGWVEGEKETRLLGLLPYVSRGWVVVNIDYRLAHDAKAPAAVEDCLKALDWVYANADNYQIDTDRIVVSGESAGGHLCLLTGMLQAGDRLCGGKYVVNNKKPVAAIINWFGATDLSSRDKMKQHVWLDPNDDAEEALRSLSPVTYVNKDNPPILSIHGSADPVVLPGQSELLHNTLDEKGVPNKLVMIPGKKHGNFSGQERTDIFNEIWKFLESNGIKTTPGKD
jgi:acetyl esterase/lipase